jgi:hypothetical protein
LCTAVAALAAIPLDAWQTKIKADTQIKKNCFYFLWNMTRRKCSVIVSVMVRALEHGEPIT